jgi:FKBP-type peptidyl-prolyl cis-trans isomerase
MLLFTLFSALLVSANAFIGSNIRAPRTELASTKMPYDDDRMPFYAVGVNFAQQIGDLNLNAVLEGEEMEIVLQAFAENLRGTATADARTVLFTYGPKLNDLLNKRRLKVLDAAYKEEEAYIQQYLEENTNATQTDSGLVYHETLSGSGKIPSDESIVQVHYHGTLLDGTVVDSSRERGQSMTVALNQLISGWREGLSQMSEGSKATLIVPSDLAYGDVGSDIIPPGATLKFDVELIQVVQQSPMSMSDIGETEVITLPDGTKMTVPKGVKMRVLSKEKEETS